MNELLLPLSGISPTGAYRADEARRGHAPLSADDGIWIAIATLLAKAADRPSPRSRYIREAVRLTETMSAHREMRSGIGVDASPPRSASRADRTSFALRKASYEAEESGALSIALSILESAQCAIVGRSVLEQARTVAHGARIKWKQGDEKTADRLFRSVVHAGKNQRIPEVQARGLIGLNILLEFRGNFPESRRLLRRVLRISEREGLKRITADALRGLTRAYTAAKDYDNALIAVWRAYEASVEADSDVSGALFNLSNLVLETGYALEAIPGFLAVIESNARPRIASFARMALAEAYAAIGDEERARGLLDEITSYWLDRAWPYHKCVLLLDCAKLHERWGDSALAGRLINEARFIAERHQFHEIVYRVSHGFADASDLSLRKERLGTKAAKLLSEVSALATLHIAQSSSPDDAQRRGRLSH